MEQTSFISVADRLPEPCEAVIGFSERWVDEDYNPDGVRECFRNDEGTWLSAAWNNSQDCYDTIEDAGPELWRDYPVP